MKTYELFRRKKKLPHNSVKSRSKLYPLKGNNGSAFNPLAFVFLLPLPLCLSGCMGIYEGGFECPPGRGVGCKSISDVNQMVNDGDLPERLIVEPPHSHCDPRGSSQNKEAIPKGHEKPEIWYSDRGLEKA